MAFAQRTYTDRQVEYPGRRDLLNVSTDESQTFDVTRNEGNIIDDGIPYNAATMNDLEGRIASGFTEADGKADPSTTVNATLSTSWSGSTTFTQAVTIAGMTAATNAILSPSSTDTQAQVKAFAAALITVTSQGTNTITVTAMGTKPTVAIPITVILLG